MEPGRTPRMVMCTRAAENSATWPVVSGSARRSTRGLAPRLVANHLTRVAEARAVVMIRTLVPLGRSWAVLLADSPLLYVRWGYSAGTNDLQVSSSSPCRVCSICSKGRQALHTRPPQTSMRSRCRGCRPQAHSVLVVARPAMTASFAHLAANPMTDHVRSLTRDGDGSK